MAAENTLRKSSHRARVVVSATLAAGTVAGALAVGAPAFADAPTTRAVASAEAGSSVSGAGLQVSAPFFEAGCTYNDAVVLAEQWKSSSTWDAKISAGEKLAAGETLPLPPSSEPSKTP